MTFNLRGCKYPQDAPNLWLNRADLTLRTLRKYSPDLIGFQEVQEGNLETLQNELAEYNYFIGTPSNEIDFYNYNTIAWKPERFELVDSGGMFLSETPHTWSKNWDSRFVRSANWVRMRCAVTGTEFLHINTHLDHVGVQARRQAAQQIIATAADLSQGVLPTFLTGDFNCIPWLPEYGSPDGRPFEDTAYQLFTSYGYQDSFLETGQIDTPHTHTFHGFQGEAFGEQKDGMAQRIDWVLFKDNRCAVTVCDAQIIRDCEPPMYPSDHYPFLAEFEFTP
jgi:endonuclease/exonuclease/phosphatase family metal-dependent hydrolase